jgi:L-threonylcarbamoyladenylate synthase
MTELITRILSIERAQALEQALAVLQASGLVAFPTDTVYGVAAQAFEAAGIEQLYLAKGRQAAKAIAILLGRLEDLPGVAAEMPLAAQKLAQRFWPGALTLVLPRHPDLPANLSPLPTVGVRMPDHPLALALLKASGPLAVTSANLSGQPSAVTAQEVLAQLGGRVHLVLDGGRTPGGIPSTVVDCTANTPVILRVGPVSAEQIEATLGTE